jgi:hypothetical protein
MLNFLHDELILLNTFLFFLTLFGCQTDSFSPTWDEDIVIEVRPEVNRFIGSDGQKASEIDNLTFGQIGEVYADSYENYYVSDYISQSIKKFDKKGNYLTEIGSRGRGAGEFMGLKSFTIISKHDETDIIVAVDDINRKITINSIDGELLSTINLSSGSEYRGKLATVELSNENKYLFLYKLHEGAKDHNCLFHLFNQDLTKEFCFGNYRDLRFHDNEAFHYLTQSHPGHFIISPDLSIFYTPRYYDGVIYNYVYNDGERSWTLKHRFEGFYYHSKPISENTEPENYRIAYQGKRLYGQMLNLSLGLFYSETGIIHFTRTTSPEGEIWFGMEKYNQEGQLLNYYKITGIDKADPNNWVEVQYIDSEGNYIFSKNFELPGVYKMSF